MSDQNKKPSKKSNRKILTVILLLILVGGAIFYFTMNLEDSGFVEPMNEEELNLLEDEEGDEDNGDDVEDETGNEDNGEEVDDGAGNDNLEDEIDNNNDDINNNDTNIDNNDDEGTNNETVSTDSTDSTDRDEISDSDSESSQIEEENASEDEIEEQVLAEPDSEDESQSEDDTSIQTDSEEQLTGDSNDLEDDNQASPDEIREQDSAEEDEGIIDQIISFLSETFNSDDREETVADNGTGDENDETNIADALNDLTEENLDQSDSDFQLRNNNLVVLGVDDLSEEQESTFDFIGLISLNADDLEVEFIIIPSRLTYEDKELREFSRDQLTEIITELTDYQIDYELILDYSGFQYYVNQINGIELELADEFNVPDLNLELTQGKNQLDGSEALNYARFYNPDNGERSRIDRQEQVIDKVYQKSLKLENLLSLPGHYNHLVNEEDAVNTDIDQEMIRNIIRYIRQLDQLSINYRIFGD